MAKKREAPAWHVVVGRCRGEDEDSPGVYWGTELSARRKHAMWLRRTQHAPRTKEVFITTVVLCSSVRADKPRVIHQVT